MHRSLARVPLALSFPPPRSPAFFFSQLLFLNTTMARSAAQFRSRQIKVAGPQRRSKLTGEDLEVLASKMRAAYKWEADPKPFQLAGVQAQLEGVDVVIQASTGAGKTAIAAGPYLWPSSAGKSTIMVCPLLSLEEEMVRFHVVKSTRAYHAIFHFRFKHSTWILR